MRFTRPGSEPSPPEKPLGLADSKRSPPHGYTRHNEGIGGGLRARNPQSEDEKRG